MCCYPRNDGGAFSESMQRAQQLLSWRHELNTTFRHWTVRRLYELWRLTSQSATGVAGGLAFAVGNTGGLSGVDTQSGSLAAPAIELAKVMIPAAEYRLPYHTAVI